jgi:hypothetical protein
MIKFLITLLIVLFPLSVWAADTCTYTKMNVGPTGVREYRWSINLDTSAGADCGATTGVHPIYGYIVGFKISHDSSPGTSGTSPATTYDLEMRDENNFDWLFGEMATGGTSETDSGNVDVPVTDSGGLPYLHGERLYPFITDADNAAAYDITIYFRVKEEK